MAQRYWQDDESEFNLFEEDSLGPIEEQIAQGAREIRTLQRKLSQASYNSVDWEYMNQFLDLESHSNYKPANSPSIGFIEESDMEFEPLDLNPLPAQIPTLPQPIQPFDQDLDGVEDRKIFNNMPGFLISAVQKLRRNLKFEDMVTEKISQIMLIKECAIKLTDKVLMQLSSKDGNREQLRMVFNEVDEDFNHDLKQKSKKSDFIITMKRYFELLKVYGEEVMNEAKNELRVALASEMTLNWMHEEAMNRAFKGQNVELKKKVFFQYMASFREEIKDG
jgi:hypothetical protein